MIKSFRLNWYVQPPRSKQIQFPLQLHRVDVAAVVKTIQNGYLVSAQIA